MNESKVEKYLALGIVDDELDFTDHFYPVTAPKRDELQHRIESEYSSWSEGSSVQRIAVYKLVDTLIVKKSVHFISETKEEKTTNE